jgi:hypothetical protein
VRSRTLTYVAPIHDILRFNIAIYNKPSLEIFDQDSVADVIAARDVEFGAFAVKGVSVNVTLVKIR